MARVAVYLIMLGLLMIVIGLGGSGPALLAAPVLLGLGGLVLGVSVMSDALGSD